MSDRRSNWLTAAVALWALIPMGRTAFTGNPVLLVTWLAAALYLLLLAPAMQQYLRAQIAAAPIRAWGMPASIIAMGMVAAFASDGGLVPWKLAIPGVVVALLIHDLDRPVAGETGGWRLIGIALLLGLLAGAWDRSLRLAVPGDMRLGFTFFLAAAAGIYLLRVVRPLPSLDVRLGLTLTDTGIALGAATLLAVLAVPLGVLANFVVWNPRDASVLDLATRWLALVIFVGLPEELLFRGLIQEGLTRLKGPRAALVIASVLFGVVHIVKFTGLLPDQQQWLFGVRFNWRYAVLAGLAGVSYGIVYQRTGKVSAAALTHGTVDWVWSAFFLRG